MLLRCLLWEQTLYCDGQPSWLEDYYRHHFAWSLQWYLIKIRWELKQIFFYSKNWYEGSEAAKTTPVIHPSYIEELDFLYHHSINIIKLVACNVLDNERKAFIWRRELLHKMVALFCEVFFLSIRKLFLWASPIWETKCFEKTAVLKPFLLTFIILCYWRNWNFLLSLPGRVDVTTKLVVSYWFWELLEVREVEAVWGNFHLTIFAFYLHALSANVNARPGLPTQCLVIGTSVYNGSFSSYVNLSLCFNYGIWIWIYTLRQCSDTKQTMSIFGSCFQKARLDSHKIL